MKIPVQFEDLNSIDYKQAWDYQESLHTKAVEGKNSKIPVNYLLFCEHPHVYTLGKSGDADNLLMEKDALARINASYYHTNRGGDITYHGPGQVVGYPILDLEAAGMGIKKYMYILEEAIIQTLKMYDIKSERLAGATGVWIDSVFSSKARKICAMGVRVSRGVTMHGFAFNVNTDLKYFSFINPCGFTDKSVTSLQKELGVEQSMETVKLQLKSRLSELLNLEFI